MANTKSMVIAVELKIFGLSLSAVTTHFVYYYYCYYGLCESTSCCGSESQSERNRMLRPHGKRAKLHSTRYSIVTTLAWCIYWKQPHSMLVTARMNASFIWCRRLAVARHFVQHSLRRFVARCSSYGTHRLAVLVHSNCGARLRASYEVLLAARLVRACVLYASSFCTCRGTSDTERWTKKKL